MSVFEQVFKKIAFESCLIIVATAGKFTADNNRIFTYNLNIFPADPYILISAHKSQASAFAPDDHRDKTAAAGVDFNVADIAEPATGFGTDYFFISEIRNTAVHAITSFDYMLTVGKVCGKSLQEAGGSIGEANASPQGRLDESAL